MAGARATPEREAFPVRIFYAPTPALIEEAAEFGYTHVVVQSFGHVRRDAQGFAADNMGAEQTLHDDTPIFFEKYPRIAAERRLAGEETILRNQQRTNEKIELAAGLGLKSFVTSYELSLPYELARCCPELYPARYSFCLNVPERRQFIEDKMAEIFEAFPGLDGYIFTTKEASEGIYYTHRCEHCAGLSPAERLNLLTETLRAGKNRVKPKADLVWRAWGTHFPDHFYRDRGRVRWEWFGKPPQFCPKTTSDTAKTYDPAEVLPEFARISHPSIVVCCKATWQDFDLHQPANPWVGAFRGHREIVEVSYEYFPSPTRKYVALTGQVERFIKLARERGVEGVMTLPASYGVYECWHEGRQEFATTVGKGTVDLTVPGVGEATVARITPYVAGRLLHDPQADLRGIVKEYIESNYSDTDADFLADLVLVCEDLVHRAMLCDGCSIHGLNHYCNNNHMQLECYKEQGAWSSCAFEEGEEKLLRQLKDLPALYAAKDAAIAEAERWLKELVAKEGKLSEGVFAFFQTAVSGLVDLLKLNTLSQKVGLTLWAIERGDVQATEHNLNFVHDCIREKEKVLLHSPIRDDLVAGSGIDRLYGFAGNQRYETVE